MNAQNIFDEISDDIQLKIFSYCAISQLLTNINRLSKKYHKIVSIDGKLWRHTIGPIAIKTITIEANKHQEDIMSTLTDDGIPNTANIAIMGFYVYLGKYMIKFTDINKKQVLNFFNTRLKPAIENKKFDLNTIRIHLPQLVEFGGFFGRHHFDDAKNLYDAVLQLLDQFFFTQKYIHIDSCNRLEIWCKSQEYRRIFDITCDSGEMENIDLKSKDSCTTLVQLLCRIIYQFQVSTLDAKLGIMPHMLFEQCRKNIKKLIVSDNAKQEDFKMILSQLDDYNLETLQLGRMNGVYWNTIDTIKWPQTLKNVYWLNGHEPFDDVSLMKLFYDSIRSRCPNIVNIKETNQEKENNLVFKDMIDMFQSGFQCTW